MTKSMRLEFEEEEHAEMVVQKGDKTWKTILREGALAEWNRRQKDKKKNPPKLDELEDIGSIA